jgi:hypothetical protein
MGRLSTFFKGADTQFGVFYPKHYLVAIFPNLAEADSAKQALNRDSLLNDDAISASGEEVIEFAQDHLAKDGLWGLLMREVSRGLGTEEPYTDDDLAAAKKGAAFVAVYCPSEKLKLEAWKVLEPRRPLVARYYAFGGIFDGVDHLVGEN